MKKFVFILVILALAITVGGCSPDEKASTKEMESKKADEVMLKQEIQSLKNKVSDLQAELDSYQNNYDKPIRNENLYVLDSQGKTPIDIATEFLTSQKNKNLTTMLSYFVSQKDITLESFKKDMEQAEVLNDFEIKQLVVPNPNHAEARVLYTQTFTLNGKTHTKDTWMPLTKENGIWKILYYPWQ